MAKVENGKSGYAILVDGTRPYIDVSFGESAERAEAERQNLLKYFPKSSPWRERLTVDWWTFKTMIRPKRVKKPKAAPK